MDEEEAVAMRPVERRDRRGRQHAVPSRQIQSPDGRGFQ